MSLTKDTLFYSLAKWGQRLAVFISAPFIIAYFTPEQYGYISLINAVASFFAILGLLAIVDQGLPRFFLDTDDNTIKQQFASTALFISTAGVFVSILVILIASPILPYVFKGVGNPLSFSLLMAAVCFSFSLRAISSNMLKWTFQSHLFVKISLVQALISATLIITGILFFEWRAKGVLLTTAATTSAASILAAFSFRQYFNLSMVSKEKSRVLFLYSWPLLGLNIFAFFSRSLDRVFLASLTSLSMVGIFSVASAVASVFETLVSGFFFALGPHILSTFRESGSPKRYAHVFNLISCVGLISIAGLGLLGGPLVVLLRPGAAYQDIGIYIPWIVCATLVYHLGGYFTPGPDIAKKTHWKFTGFAIAGIANGVLNYLLIPRLGIIGAVIATAIASFMGAVFNIVVSNHLYTIPLKWKFNFTLIIAVTTLVSLLQSHHLLTHVNMNEMTLRCALTLIVVIIALLIYRKDIMAANMLKRVWKKS